jgi:hypothetical protein
MGWSGILRIAASMSNAAALTPHDLPQLGDQHEVAHVCGQGREA